ncbi:MAG: NTP/NDP exchange transporter [Phycisphaerales bacterium JB039]
MSALTSPIRQLTLVRRGEGRALAWAAGLFFCILFGYYLLRPMRDEMGIRGDLDALPWLWTGTSLAMLVAAPLFGLLVSRAPRRVFLPLTYIGLAGSLVVFFGLFEALPEGARLGAGYAFYIWLSVLNLFATAVFWGFMADIFTPEQGTRLFGAIGVGGTVGAICGSAVPAWLVRGVAVGGVTVRMDAEWLLLGAAGMMLLAVVCVRRLMGEFGIQRGSEGMSAGTAAAPKEPGRDALKGFKLIATSPYLLGMCAYMLLYTVTASYAYFEEARIVKSVIETTEGRTAFYGQVNLAVNGLTLLTQLFLTGRLLKRFGVIFGLLLMPALMLGGFAALAIAPALATLFIFRVAQRGLHYAVDKPARETLYTVLGPEEKYKSKSFIDTFVYRGGDLLGAWTHAAALAAGQIVLIVAPLAAVWAVVAAFLAARRKALLRARV